MKKYKKINRIIAFFSAVLMIVLCVGFQQPQYTMAESNTTIRIPYGFNTFLNVSEEGEVSGYYAEYLEELANINNWKYEYVKATWTEAIDMLENGEIDFLFPTNYSEERDETMDFSSIPIGYTSVGIFALQDSDYNYEDFESLNGARIACAANSTNAEELAIYAKNQGFSYTLIPCKTNDEMIAAVEDRDADLAVFSAANQFPGSKLVAVFSAAPVFFTVKVGNTEMLSKIDSGMQEIIRENIDLVSETMKKTLIGENGSVSAFTSDEKKFIESGEEIVVGFYEESEPLAYVDDDGNYKGIYIEFLSHIMEKSGVKFTPYPIKRNQKWQDLIKSGDIDFYIGSSDIIVFQDDDIHTTHPFMEYSNFLVTKRDRSLNQIEKPVISMTYARTNWAEYLENKFGKELEFKYYRTTKECMLSVATGKADAALINNLEYNYHMKNPRFSTLTYSTQYRYPTKISMASSADIDPNIFSAINKMIHLTEPDYIDMISDESLTIPYHSYSFVDYLYNMRFALLIIGGVLIIAFFSALFHKSKIKIKEEANQKEQEILRILAALSDDYSAIYYTDLDEDRCTIIRLPDDGLSEMYRKEKHSEAMELYLNNMVAPKFHDVIKPYCDPKNIIEKFKEEKAFYIRYQVLPSERNTTYYEMCFVNAGENGKNKMVFGIRCVDEVVNAEKKQRQILEDALKSANRANAAKSDFLSMMSHDIRTPMNAIIGMTAIASAHAEEPDRVRDSLNKIASSSQYLLSLINDVLDMSKIESGKFKLTQENLNLTALLNELIEMIQPQIKQHNHTLTVDMKNIEHNDVIGDKLRLQQIFMNLMSNAIKYTPDGGNISFSVNERKINKNTAACFEFVFKDDGIGMSKELAEHIFEPFVRAEDLRTSKVQGTGLGLPITKNVINMMNGSIEVKSELKKGSTFFVTIFLLLQDKAKNDKESENVSDMTKIHTGDFSGKRILLVEDNDLNREIAREIFEMSGLIVEEAEDGQIAFDKFSESDDNYYDMIFMDVQMPNLNGYDATRAIRNLKSQYAKNIPIVAMTANAFVEDIKTSEATGMNEHLSKPIDFAKLEQILEKYL